jgi:hypothetical protein
MHVLYKTVNQVAIPNNASTALIHQYPFSTNTDNGSVCTLCTSTVRCTDSVILICINQSHHQSSPLLCLVRENIKRIENRESAISGEKISQCPMFHIIEPKIPSLHRHTPTNIVLRCLVDHCQCSVYGGKSLRKSDSGIRF